MKTADQLNGAYGIEGKLMFVPGKGGLVMIKIDTELASSSISTYGGQVLSYQPASRSFVRE